MQDDNENAVMTLVMAQSPKFRRALLAKLENKHAAASTVAKPERIVRRKEAALTYGCTTRTIDNLCRTGALPRVRLPGRERALGIRESDLMALITGKGKCDQKIAEGGSYVG